MLPFLSYVYSGRKLLTRDVREGCKCVDKHGETHIGGFHAYKIQIDYPKLCSRSKRKMTSASGTCGVYVNGSLTIEGNLVIDSSVDAKLLTVEGNVVVKGDVIVQGSVTAAQKATKARSGKAPQLHTKCRNCIYNKADNIIRFTVPDDKVLWTVPFPEYSPVDYTNKVVLNKPVWADIDLKSEKPEKCFQWNMLDGKVDRRSHTGKYEIVNDLPRNPVGRTGVCGRGWLGRWGPNHAADPIVTRWKRDENNKIIIDKISGKPVLQFVSILRNDTREWAIPGGMVDAGEEVTVTLVREFCEEAMNSEEVGDQEKAVIEATIKNAFNNGLEIYRGYVDDPRNTDNSWMETVAVNFHDESGENMGRFHLHAGDDAVGVRWTDISKDLQLYASHINFVYQTVLKHAAHW